MGLGFSSSWSLSFCVLLVLMSAEASKGEYSLQEHEDGGEEAMARKHIHTHMDMSMRIFFTITELKVGKRIPVYFSKRDPATSPHLLPREEVESIPFSSAQLPYLLQFFGFSQGSPQAIAMENTLRHCETEPIEGETKSCVTSLESMLDFSQKIFGLKASFEVISTKLGEKTTIFYCHFQEGENKVFEVSLGGENGDRVEAVAVCHMDTSQWNQDHVSFRLLGVQPGASPVCHFFPADNLIWVPSPALIQD
ncbi:BURP domain-containing protein BNM2C [Vitis vinifera]|uniref:BURP domain-containing protein BNM2C n=1 Tax=Vitis vinifera TaxID=29760 RepID=A0A438C0V3_VITVI|nr:BURP domain-containing protein BNM2C [Vitis vinifera]